MAKRNIRRVTPESKPSANTPAGASVARSLNELEADRKIRALDKTVARVEFGGVELVMMDAARYDALAAKAEDAEDAKIAAASADYAEEDLIPSQVVHRIVRGENPLKVWREHRGLKAIDVARRAGVTQSYYSQLESGKREGSLTTISRLAIVLDCLVDDLVPANRSDEDLTKL
jgi:DNA-binding Xre family transcriptional regulator